MAFGPGKYNEQAARALESTDAKGVILIVIGGTKGDGIEIQFRVLPGMSANESGLEQSIPRFLREIADELERTKSVGQG